MPVNETDLKHLRAAEGFAALGMLEEADAEVECIDPFCRRLPEVLAVRLVVYQEAERWELAQVVGKQLLVIDPLNPAWPVSLAYATRRVESTEAARAILVEAAVRHPKEAMIRYNLGCYDCQLGAIESAKAHLKIAFELWPECRAAALEDEELEPLWDSLREG